MANEPSSTTTPPNVTVQYMERPDAPEIFADSVEFAYFDGQTLRVELCVSWMDRGSTPAAARIRRQPQCRLVMTSSAAIELANRMQKVFGELIKTGVLKAAPTQ